MDRAFYIAVQGAQHNTLSLTSTANNLANATTTGFKRDFNQTRAMPIFGAVLASRAFALTERPATDFTQGTLQITDNALDISVNNGSLFAVQQEDGSEGYLSSASLNIDANGNLVAKGLKVLGAEGAITLPTGANILINRDGSINVGNLTNVAQIKLVNAKDRTLSKDQNGVITAKEKLEQDFNATVTSGMLEQSNVNVVNEMTNILELSKHFELNLKVMHATDENNFATTKLLAMN